MVFVALAIGTLVSEDLACITAGLLIREGRIGFAEGVGACALGILLGDVGLWAVGSVLRRVTLTAGSIEQDAPADSKRGWRDALARPAERWLRRMRPDDMRGWLESNAARAIVGSRFLPGTRLPLYVCAGLIGLPLATFAGWASVAVLLWTPLVVNAAAMAGGAVMGATPEAGGPAWASRAALAVALLAGLRLVRWLLIAAPHGHGAAWLARWSRWEFWPMWLFYAPVAAWVALLSLRYRGLSTITASNPGIEDGGVVGESKFGILSKLPADAIIPSAMVPISALEGLTIVELNGATAESTDIYDPAGTLIAAYRTLFRQWAIVFAIGSANRATGAPVSSLRRLASLVRTHLTSRPAFVLSD